MEDQTTQTTSAEPSRAKNMRLLYTTIGIVVLLGLGALYFIATDQLPDNPIGGDATDETGPVAIVNGEEISREQFNENLAQFRASVEQSGATLSDDEIKEQTVSAMVNNRLLVQGATDAGIVVTDEDVTAELELIEENAGGAEALDAQLNELALSREELRDQIREQLSINKYVEAEADFANITVSEEDITSFYENISASNEQFPPLDDVRPQIEQQLILQKQQERVSELIDELRADAEIEILI